MSDPNDTSSGSTGFTGTEASTGNFKYSRAGEKIKVPKKIRHILKRISKKMDANNDTIKMLSRSNRRDNEMLWGIIRDHLPETKNYNCSYDPKKKTITIIGKA